MLPHLLRLPRNCGMSVEQPAARQCPKCGQSLPLDQFGKDKHREDGLTCWCKPCRRIAVQRWESAHPESLPKRKRRWRARHINEIRAKERAERAADPERIRSRERFLYARNRAAILRQKAAWRRAHPEYRRRNSRLYYQRHKAEFIARYVRSYRARKRHAEGRYTAADIERIAAAQRRRCAYCPKRLRKGSYHIDHIVPLIAGGTNFSRNLQLTCVSCNTRKGGQDPLDFARRLGQLL